jgi:hypothetical protein
MHTSLDPSHEIPAGLGQSYSSANLAKRLDIGKETPRIWRQRGVGPRYQKIGRLVRYAEGDVMAWLAQQQATP